MKIIVAAAAERELDAAMAWYRLQQAGLQEGFLAEFRATLMRIQAQPEIYSELRPGIRRALMRRFPYSVIYEVLESSLLILAIAHQHRKPYYWEQK
jgi:plasmid stabilization system protein ParE